MKHRAEIDGLRAVAVAPVVLFHTGYSVFGGGYLGVDVFFVISGYLITAIIDGEMREGRFSFIRFYERRARRILPALVAVTAACFIAGLWVMMPSQLYSMALTVAALSVFASNILYSLRDSYFAESNLYDPLIHTWSLAIEEQYYVVAPILMLLVWRYAPRFLVHAILAIAVVTLAHAELRTRAEDEAAYYLLSARAWQLAAGALLALAEARVGRSSRFAAAGAGLGLAAILLAYALFDGESRHPGLVTLLPVGGAAAVIWFCDGRDPVSRLLSTRALVGVGLISYSLYLWHQPVFAYARLATVNELPALAYVLLIALSVAVAAASWRWIEQPFRDRRRVAARPLWLAAGGSVAALMAVSIYTAAGRGLPGRFPPDLLEVIAASVPTGYVSRDGEECNKRPVQRACVIGAGGDPTWALVGDSQLAAIGRNFDAALRRAGVSALQLTINTCVYAPDLLLSGSRSCLKRNAEVRERILRDDIDTVVLMGRYVRLLENARYDNGEGGIGFAEPEYLHTPGAGPSKDAARRKAVADVYRGAVEELLAAGKRVVLVYPVPEMGWHVPRTIFLKRRKGDETPVDVSFESFRRRTAATVAAFDAVGDHPNLIRVRPSDLWCDTVRPGRCAGHLGDEIFYTDDNHLNVLGGERLVSALMERLAAVED